MKDNSIYKVGLYIRLSREDEDNNDESQSITNQRSFLQEYVKNNNFNYIDSYIDDGYTGTNFDRPGFKRMLMDIESGRINTVITKDMSRLGRDYIGIGNYIEKYFPEHNIRYIAINDRLDTINGNSDDMTPFKAIFNDYYAKDISNKVRSIIANKKRCGQFLGGVPPYGYKFKSETDHYHLVIDEETSKIVKRMFDLYVSGKSLDYIAKTFTKEGIPIPSVKKQLNRGLKSTAYGNWQTRTIDEMLKNPTYIGNLTQGRRKKINYKLKKIVRVPKEDWIVVENTHEPIIDKNTFERVQNIYKINKNKQVGKTNLLLTGFIYCQECGHRIGVNGNLKKGYYCACNYYKKYSKVGLCTPHSIPYKDLEDTILTEIRNECKKSVKDNDFENILKNNNRKAKLQENLKLLVKKKNNDININKNAIEELYVEKLKKAINEEQFNNVYNKLNNELANLEKELKYLNEQYNNLVENSKIEKNDYTQVINDYLALKKPTRELLASIVDKITIDETKNITIYYKIKQSYF